MIPLAQYLTDRDGDGGFQSFAPQRPKRAAKRPADFKPVGDGRAAAAPAQAFEGMAAPAGDADFPAGASDFPMAHDGGFEVDTSALLNDMESELRDLAAPQAPTQDARALQNELKAKAGGINSSKALEAARQAAFEQGRSEALAEAEADRQAAIEAALEEERAAAEIRQAEAIEAARAEWVDAEGTRIADGLTEQTTRLGDAMRMTLASILRPLALNTRQRQSVEELVTTISALAFDGQAMSVKASGPADLMEKLEDALSKTVPHVTLVPSEGESDVKVEIGQTVIQSRLGEWRKALEAALS